MGFITRIPTVSITTAPNPALANCQCPKRNKLSHALIFSWNRYPCVILGRK